MKQTARIISTYTGDTSGVCSALFELGGMCVMHDASGCNSTYSTHDEPRWYDFDSLVFISGLTEAEAMMGDDSKLIRDTVAAADLHHPRFIALAGTPIPMMTGVDFTAIAHEIEEETGIPSFGFDTDGMHSYVSGAGAALAAIARRFCTPMEKSADFTVNILGATPLDFSVNGSINSMKMVLAKHGVQTQAVWAMESNLERISESAKAHANLVVSSVGMEAARVLQQRFGIPYVVGTPIGEEMTALLANALRTAADTGESSVVCKPDASGSTVIIGESVTSLSLACAMQLAGEGGATVLSPMETPAELLQSGARMTLDEDDIIPYLEKAKRIIADPLYFPVCPKTAKLISLPHEAFSGRIYREQIPDLITNFYSFLKEILK